jgi:hypothetical protein
MTSHRHAISANLPVFASTLDSLVRVLVEVGKVLPYFFVSGVDYVAVFDGCELAR